MLSACIFTQCVWGNFSITEFIRYYSLSFECCCVSKLHLSFHGYMHVYIGDPFSGAVQFQGSAVMGVHTNLTVNTTSGFDYSAKVCIIITCYCHKVH